MLRGLLSNCIRAQVDDETHMQGIGTTASLTVLKLRRAEIDATLMLLLEELVDTPKGREPGLEGFIGLDQQQRKVGG